MLTQKDWWSTSLPVAHTESEYDTSINAYTVIQYTHTFMHTHTLIHTHTHTLAPLICSLQSDSCNQSGIDLRVCENQARKEAVNITASDSCTDAASTATAINIIVVYRVTASVATVTVVLCYTVCVGNVIRDVNIYCSVQSSFTLLVGGTVLWSKRRLSPFWQTGGSPRLWSLR